MSEGFFMLSCPVTFLDRELRHRPAWSSDWLSDLAELRSKGKSRDDSASGFRWDDKHVMSHAGRTPMNSCSKHDSASWRFSSASHHFLTLDPCLFVIGGFPPHLLALRCASALPGLCDSQPFQSRGLLQPIPGYPVQDCHPLGGPHLCHLQPVSLHLQARRLALLGALPGSMGSSHCRTSCCCRVEVPVTAVSLSECLNFLPSHHIAASAVPLQDRRPAISARGEHPQFLQPSYSRAWAMEGDSGGHDPDDRQYKRLKTARDYEREARRPDKQTRKKIKEARERHRSEQRTPRTPRPLTVFSAPRAAAWPPPAPPAQPRRRSRDSAHEPSIPEPRTPTEELEEVVPDPDHPRTVSVPAPCTPPAEPHNKVSSEEEVIVVAPGGEAVSSTTTDSRAPAPVQVKARPNWWVSLR